MERVTLIDRILDRKQEIKSMKEKMALYKLAPVLQILINKVKKKKDTVSFKQKVAPSSGSFAGRSEEPRSTKKIVRAGR